MDQISSEGTGRSSGDSAGSGEAAIEETAGANDQPVTDQETAANDGGTVDGDPTQVPTDEMFALLSNGRRRHVLRFLQSNGGEIKLRELATAIAAEENGVEPVEVTYTQRKRLYTSLYQSHLPRMERSGVIEYDRNSGLVTLAPAAGDFDAYLEVVGENEFTWSEFYLGLTVLFAAVTIAYASGTPPFAALGPAVVMGAMTGLLLVASAAHVRYTRGRRL
ncbi:DUF7344 domain-containing protein [Halorubrum halodurans]|uniref:DUF7344 domain-containing protein n=1 Tax=Halorubrum halodurans TaxID=1383851 RepID=A0A256IKD5_9EURY|nr:hypothetical protein [Halorubrum halodurans]OYR56776.1 hypothetical protein DJ70_07675 [Halorubrum halodurans]